MSHDEQVLSTLQEIQLEITRIRTVLAPDENKPNVISQLDDRVERLEDWRNYLLGAWGALCAAVGFGYVRRF